MITMSTRKSHFVFILKRICPTDHAYVFTWITLTLLKNSRFPFFWMLTKLLVATFGPMQSLAFFAAVAYMFTNGALF
jgi:hypothetical protein